MGHDGLTASESCTTPSLPGRFANRKQVAIIVQDEAGVDKARFVVTDAWPSKYTVSGLNGKGNEVMIELIELVNEGIERVQ